MRSLGAFSAGSLLLLLFVAAPAGAADLVLKRVALSSGGVGYLEYEASVEGDAELNLDIPLDQVDDVLKSLVVYDDNGRAGEITLPGREPLAQSFADLPFDPAALASLKDLLNALQGAEIRVGGDQPVTGRLVHAEDATQRTPDGGSETVTRIGLWSDDGLREVTVKNMEAVAFTDPVLAAQVKSALTRIAAYRAQDRRQLSIALHGQGRRTVRVGYVVAMPLWKASYRLNLPADPAAGTARLQGWAVLENFSGTAWNGVELTLLSGEPVTFRQALYESYYVTRPVVPVTSGNRVLPPPDTGTLGEAAPSPSGSAAPFGLPRPASRTAESAAAPALAAPAMPAPAPPPAPAQLEQANAADDATQIAFTLPDKVSVAAGQSLVVPLIDRDLPAHGIDLYQPATAAHHPLAAVELTNAAAVGLPPGVLTIYRQGDRGAAYLGDARLAPTPAGETRLLNYAVDQKVSVEQSTATTDMIVKATIADGVMHLVRLDRRTTTYRISAAAPPPGLVIEQPKRDGWTLAAPGGAMQTQNAYRIPATLDAKGDGTLTVVEERPNQEAIELTGLSDDRLGVFVAARELDPKLRAALSTLADRRREVARDAAELDRLNEARSRLTDDETRLRDNYTAVKDDPAMRKAMLDKLKAAEAALDDNASAAAKASAALDAAKTGLAAYVTSLSL